MTRPRIPYAIHAIAWVLLGLGIGVAGATQTMEPETVTVTETSVVRETVYQCADGRTSTDECPEPTTTSTTQPLDRSDNIALKALCQAQYDQECVYDSRFDRWVPDPLG